MIAIRVDANPVIGTGHIMRCLSIAAGLESIGEEIIMITADGAADSLIEQAGLRHITLNTDWKLLSDETDLLNPILKHLSVSLLLIDSYLVTPQYMKELKNNMTVAYIDDLLSDVYPADILINYNITSARPKYEALYGKSRTLLLLGTKYAPLRPEFHCIKPFAVHDRMKRIFISAGGADSYGFTTVLAERLLHEKDFADIHLIAVPGILGCHDQLQKLSQSDPRLELIQHPRTVKESMETCDAAVSAGGSTLYELCACGIPTAVFSLADNQVGAREAFCALQIMVDCGDIRDGKTECLDHIIGALLSLESPAARAPLSEKASEITDGLGALRIAVVLANVSRKLLPGH